MTAFHKLCVSLFSIASRTMCSSVFQAAKCAVQQLWDEVRYCFHCRQKGLQTGVRDSGPKGCTNQNCAVKEISKPSRERQALGHTLRLTKWDWGTLKTGVYIFVQFRCKYRRVSFYATFFFPRDFALTRLENLHHFLNLRDNARFNATWHTRSVVALVLCCGCQPKVTSHSSQQYRLITLVILSHSSYTRSFPFDSIGCCYQNEWEI
jgi:hypothetical protein